MATEIEAARQLMYHVCSEIDSGRRCDTKLNAVERYWRDARLTRIFEGTSEIQQRIISDQLLGRPRDD